MFEKLRNHLNRDSMRFPKKALGAKRVSQLTIIGFVCFLMTCFVAGFVQNNERQREHYRLSKVAGEVLIDLENLLQETLTTPLFLQSFFVSSSGVNREEFRTYTRLLVRHRPFIQALEWIPSIPGESRKTYETAVQTEGYLGYQIQEIEDFPALVPAKEKAHYHPIHFIEPEKGNENLLGADLDSEPKRMSVLHQACETGDTTVSPLLPLFQQPEKHGFFVAAPFVRRGQCEGVLGAIIKLDDIIAKALSKVQDKSALYTLTLTEDIKESNLEKTDPILVKAGDDVLGFGVPVMRKILLGKQVWTAEIQFRPVKRFSWYGYPFWVTLAIGTSLTGLLLLYLQLLMRYSKEIEWTVFQRTQELEHTKTVLENEIEENLKTQQLLSKTERSYRQILDAITDMVLVKGPGSRILWANEAFCHYYGMTREQLKNLIDSPVNAPDHTKQYVRDDEKVFSTGFPLNIPSEPVTRHDGEIKFFHTVKSPIFDKDGKVIQTVGVSRDISDRLHKEEKLQEMTDHLRQSEEKFRSLVLNIPGAIYRCAADSNWTMEFISESIEDLCGYPASEIIHNRKRTFASIIHPEDREKVEKKVAEALQEKKPYTLEYRFLHADGSVRWVYEKGQGVFSEEGNVLCLDGGIFDVTERKNWEKKIQQTQKLEAVGKLAGGIAHDFNNQLMVIGGYCTLILGEIPKESPIYSQLMDIKAAAEKSSHLTRQLLALGRKQIITPKVFDPNQLLRSMTNIIQTLIGVQIELKMELAGSLPPIRMDTQQFEQALINLVMNARDAMPQGGKLTFRTSQTTQDAKVFDVIEIQDTGTGMDKEVKAHLFEPFFTTKDRAKGSGLGLATCYAMLQEANGKIEVQSESGQGTLFKLYFPAAQDEAVQKPMAAEVKLKFENSGRVLLVDDEASVRGVVVAILKARGYVIAEASSGAEALQLAEGETSPFDLLITDIMMPGMDGRELVRQFRPKFPDTATLFISGYADKFSREEFEETPLLEKPFSPELLIRKVFEVLELYKNKRNDLRQRNNEAA